MTKESPPLSPSISFNSPISQIVSLNSLEENKYQMKGSYSAQIVSEGQPNIRKMSQKIVGKPHLGRFESHKNKMYSMECNPKNNEILKVNFGSDIEQIRESKLEDSVSIFSGSIKCLCVPKILIVDDQEFNILTIQTMIKDEFPDIKIE